MLPTSSHRRGRRRRPGSAGPTSTCSASTPTGPIPGIDGLGLVPALDGCKIVALSAEGAILETPGGARQSYRRKAGSAGPGAGVEAGIVTGSGRDAGRHRSPISCPPLLGDFGDHVVIARYPLQQPPAPAVRYITGQLADFCGTPPPIGG